MPWYPVKQPDSKYAIFSTIVDTFVVLDCDSTEVLTEFRQRYPDIDPRTLSDDITQALANVDAGQPAWSWAHTWPECVHLACLIHGELTDGIKMAIESGLLTQVQADRILAEALAERERDE